MYCILPECIGCSGKHACLCLGSEICLKPNASPLCCTAKEGSYCQLGLGCISISCIKPTTCINCSNQVCVKWRFKYHNDPLFLYWIFALGLLLCQFLCFPMWRYYAMQCCTFILCMSSQMWLLHEIWRFKHWRNWRIEGVVRRYSTKYY